MKNDKRPPKQDKGIASVPSPVTSAAMTAMPVIYSQQIAVQQQAGPLPSPEVLARYESIQPGLVNRIVSMAEKEAEHRRQIEFAIVDTQSRDQKSYRRSELLGQSFGLIIGLAAILGAVYAGTHGAQIAGTFIGTGGVIGLVSAFILGRTSLYKFRQQEFEHQDALKKEQRESHDSP